MQISMDKKYRTRRGESVRILCTDMKGSYPVAGAVFTMNGNEACCTWTLNGETYVGRKNEFDLVEVSPCADFEKDDPVMVRMNDYSQWQRRYFSHEKSGMAFAFDLGATSWSSSVGTTMWTECRRPTPEELNA